MICITYVSDRHASAIETLAGDPAIAATSNVPHPYPRGGGTQFVTHAHRRWRSGQSRVFAIEAAGALAGIIALNGITRDTAQLDYWVGVPFQGQGVGTRAAALAIDHARRVLGVLGLTSCCLQSNVASARVLEKNGFVRIGPGSVGGKPGSRHHAAPLWHYRLALA
jgi:RimJ/RimL family protein N-acetyltransferase